MTLKQQCFDLIERLPDDQLPHYVAFLTDAQKLYNEALSETLDDAFCIALAQRHQNCPYRDEPSVPIEELAEKWGIDLNEN
jgi:hypothetical protein